MREIEELSALMTDLARIRKVFFFTLMDIWNTKGKIQNQLGIVTVI